MSILFWLLFLLLFFRLWTYLSAKYGEKLSPPQGKFTALNGSRVHYLREGKGRPVFLIHGAYGSMNDFTHSIFKMLARDFDVTVFDRPGFGYSQRSESSAPLNGQVLLMHELMRHLEIRRPLLVGHSLGAALALAYAVKYPQETAGIVSIGGYVVPPEMPLDLIYTVPGIPVLGPFIVDTFLGPIGKWAGKTVAGSVFWPEPIPKGFLKISSSMALRPASFKDNAADVRDLAAFLTPLVSRYHEIKAPVTIVTGDSDLVSLPERHAEALHQAIQGSRLIVLPSTGHQPCFTQPEKIVSIIQNAPII